MRPYALVVALTAAVAVSLSACGGHRHTTSGKKNPKWVDQGGGAFKDANGHRILYGVGILGNVKNPGLARQSVDNRAIADIGKTIQTYSTQLARDYQSSIGSTDEGGKESGEQLVENTIKTFSQVTLSGVTIVDHWTDHEAGTYYALARLDMESFKQMLEQSNQVSEKVKEYIKKNAESAFDRLAKEEDKHSEE